MPADFTDALTEYVEARLAEALIDAGRRPEPARKVAQILAPTVASLLADPLVQKATGCDHCEGTVTEHESHCMRGR
jgi:hypothetical protein